MIQLDLNDPDIMSTKEAAERWRFKTDSSIRQRINEFPPGTARKFGRDWVVTAEGMEAVFGKEGGERKVNRKPALTEEEKQEIRAYFESVGFLLGGLSLVFRNIEKSALYGNLMNSGNIRKSEWVKNRIWPPFQDNVFRHVRLDDEVTKKHMSRVLMTKFEMSLQEARDGYYTSLIFLNASDGAKHLSYIRKRSGDKEKAEE